MSPDSARASASPLDGLLRVATPADIGPMFRVRYAVQENTLRPGRIDDEDVRAQIVDSGRGWVVECDGQVVAFAIGNASDGNVWALFVDPPFHGRGFGSRLHDAMVDWLWSRGLTALWLHTGKGTRAQEFYERRGWRAVGEVGTEIRYELHR